MKPKVAEQDFSDAIALRTIYAACSSNQGSM
jgi:hypothetical protein